MIFRGGEERVTVSLILQGTATNSLQSGLPLSITQGSTRAVSPSRRDPCCWSTGEETGCHVHKDPCTTRRGLFFDEERSTHGGFFLEEHTETYWIFFFSGAKEGAKNHTKKKPAIKKDSMRGLHQRGCGDRKCHSI